MLRHLLTGTALLTSALLGVSTSAQAEMKVVISGFQTFQAGMFDSKAANDSHRDFRSESEIHFKATGRTDNGLSYGAKVELMTSTSDSTNGDEVSMYLSGKWGRVELGDNDGASDSLTVLAPTVGIGQINGSVVNYIPTTSRPAGNVKNTGGGIIKPMDTDDSTKVTYTTPRINGLQAGISYVPEVDDNATGEQVQFSTITGTQRDAIEAGLNYRVKFADYAVRVGAGYVTSQAKKTSGREDVSSWGLGAQADYMNVTIGGGYVDNGDSNNLTGIKNDNESAWNIGARYRVKNWGFALNYLNENYGANGGRGTTTGGGDYESVIFGGSYKIADGLTTGADVAYFNRNRQTGADDHGYVMVLETKALF